MDQRLLSILQGKSGYSDLKQDILAVREGRRTKMVSDTIGHVLSRGENKVEVKLMAMRLLKGCFTQGNREFIQAVEQDILPLLRKIQMDRANQNSYCKYASRCYSTDEEVKVFKTHLMSLFQLVEECIVSWSDWQGRYLFGSKGFKALHRELQAEKLLTGGKKVYFDIRDEVRFKNNLNPAPKEAQQAQHILSKLDQLHTMSRGECKRLITDLTNQLDTVTDNMKPLAKVSIEREFQNKIARISLKSPIVRKPKEEQGKEKEDGIGELSLNSMIVHPKGGLSKELSELSTALNSPSGSVNKVVSFVERVSLGQSVSKWWPKGGKRSLISSWNSTLREKVSEANINLLKRAMLKETSVLFEDEDIHVSHCIQDVSEEKEIYKLRLTIKLKHNKEFRFIESSTHKSITFRPLQKVSQAQYKQVILLKEHPCQELAFYHCQVNGRHLEFPLPFCTLSRLLKGLLSRTRSGSCFRGGSIQSPLLNLNPTLVPKSSDLRRFFPHSMDSVVMGEEECMLSCLLHQSSDSMLLLKIQTRGTDRAVFEVDLLDRGSEEMGHSVVECLRFLFQAYV